ncbi:MAG: hemolysin family protein [Actinomycetota bacterium]|nr:hemolysin family protein [Actinomycetota bacterium]
MPSALAITLGVILLLLGGLMAAAEEAVRLIDRVRAHHLIDQKRKGAERVLKIAHDRARHLNSLAFLRVAAYASLIAVLLGDAAEDNAGGAIATVVVAVVLLFVGAELLPRALVRRRADSLATSLSGLTYGVGRVLIPVGHSLAAAGRLLLRLRRGGDEETEGDGGNDEGRSGIGTEQPEEIEEDERELIHSIFEFGDTVVREVMVPRTDMVAVPADCRTKDGLETITNAGYSRIPIFDGDTDNIVGVLYAKDLLKRIGDLDPDSPVGPLGRAPLFVPEQKKVADLLREMQQQRIHMAIVVDEYGGTAGLVTIEDLIEEIVGEIVDEYDVEEPLVEPISDDVIRVSARMRIDEVNEMLDVELPHEEWDTVGGLVFGLMGRVPSPGEKVSYDSLEFMTEKVTGRRIQKVVIRKFAEEPAPDTE